MSARCIFWKDIMILPFFVDPVRCYSSALHSEYVHASVPSRTDYLQFLLKVRGSRVKIQGDPVNPIRDNHFHTGHL